MSYRLALTGSIGMGKSTVAAIFADEGVPVWDADATVHRLYAKGGAAVVPVNEAFPGVVTGGAIDREKLRDRLTSEAEFDRIKAIVHPLVAEDRAQWADAQSADILLFDVPLVFENGNEVDFDGVAVVDAPAETQRARVLARPGMTEEVFERIQSLQMPNREKTARADFVIPSVEMDETRLRVVEVLREIRESLAHA